MEGRSGLDSIVLSALTCEIESGSLKLILMVVFIPLNGSKTCASFEVPSHCSEMLIECGGCWSRRAVSGCRIASTLRRFRLGRGSCSEARTTLETIKISMLVHAHRPRVRSCRKAVPRTAATRPYSRSFARCGHHKTRQNDPARM
jgi:hypothetical protein